MTASPSTVARIQVLARDASGKPTVVAVDWAGRAKAQITVTQNGTPHAIPLKPAVEGSA